MSDRTASRRGGWPAGADDGWGPSTAVRGGSSRGSDVSSSRERDERRAPRGSMPPVRPPGSRRNDAWTPPGRPTNDRSRANRQMERQLESLRGSPQPRERGIPGWAAFLVLVVIAVLGGLIDTVASIQVKGGFNFGIVIASIVAILIVKRSHMFPIVIAPPIVYSLGAVFQLYLRSGGLHDKKVVFDAAANYLVYGFPAIAAATAAVLIIAGIRLIARR